jgi:hypothetical protein
VIELKVFRSATMLALATVAVEGILPNLSRYTKEYDPGLWADRSHSVCA